MTPPVTRVDPADHESIRLEPIDRLADRRAVDPGVEGDLLLGAACSLRARDLPPRLLPQITRLTTGASSDDPRFTARSDAFRRLGRRWAPEARHLSPSGASSLKERPTAAARPASGEKPALPCIFDHETACDRLKVRAVQMTTGGERRAGRSDDILQPRSEPRLRADVLEVQQAAARFDDASGLSPRHRDRGLYKTTTIRSLAPSRRPRPRYGREARSSVLGLTSSRIASRRYFDAVALSFSAPLISPSWVAMGSMLSSIKNCRSDAGR